MNSQLAFISIVLGITTVLALGVALISWRRRREAVWVYPFMLAALAAAWWSFFFILELRATTLEQKIIWAQVQYFAIVFISPLWFLFAMGYTNHLRWFRASRALPLFIVPVITIVLLLANEWYQLIWQTVSIDVSGSFPVFDPTYGMWFWFYSAYSYFLLLSATVALLLFVYRSPKPYRQQNIPLIVGVLLPWAANLIYLMKFSWLSNIDLSPVAFVVSASVILWSIFRFQLFDVVPYARRLTVDAMQDGVIVLDAQNRVVDINQAALTMVAVTMSEVIGKSIATILADWPDLVETYIDVASVETEIKLDTHEGDRYFSLNILPLTNSRQQVNGRLIIFHDITTYKAAQKELAQARDEALEASRVKTELLSRVSHELRTPLNVILGYTEMLQEGVLGSINERQFSAMEKILVSSRFLTQQVNDLLDFSSIEVGSIEIHCTHFPISEIMVQVVGSVAEAAKEKSLSLSTEIIIEPPALVYGDRERVVQILTNLVDNAIKFSNEGVIRLSAFQENAHYWAMAVSDQGPGIPATAHDLIFEPFRQIDGSMTRIHGGTGLGLAIVKQLTEHMGGAVRLISEVGQGSTFVILLPNGPSAEAIDI